MTTKEEKWVRVFLEVALRALRRVHYEYGIWGAGRQWKSGPDRPSVINMGHGLELADERAVCAAIVQEFMTSPSLTGLWRESGNDQLRFFSVLREEPYQSSSDPQHPKMVDLIVEKYEFRNNVLDVYEPRSYIEAKRARLWQLDLVNGTATATARQTQAVCEDVRKLLSERAAKNGDLYIHVMVWGLYEETPDGVVADSSDHPDDFFEAVRQKASVRLEGPFVRWLPIMWEPAKESSPSRNPDVRRSAWIALAEIDRQNRAV